MTLPIKQKELSEHQELINRSLKMSYWLGYTWSALNALLDNPEVAECQKDPIKKLLKEITPGLNDLYYNN